MPNAGRSLLRILLIAMVIVFVALPFGGNLKACEEGWTSGSMDVIVYQGLEACSYHVDFCYQCGTVTPGGNVPNTIIDIKGFYMNSPGGCSQTLSASEILAQLRARLLDPYYLAILCGQFPPCDDYYFVTLTTPMCWYKSNPSGSIIFNSCPGTSECISTWKYCWDAINQVYRITTFGQPGISGPFSCSSVQEPNPGDDNYPPLGEVTPCFFVITDCNQ